MTLRTFSSILPFTRRFGVRGVTCVTGGDAIGGLGGGSRIAKCPIWKPCGYCAPIRSKPNNDECVIINCPRCGGEFEIQRTNMGVDLNLTPTASALISGDIAQQNLRRAGDSSLPFYHFGREELDKAKASAAQGVLSQSKRMDLVLEGLVYLSKQHECRLRPLDGNEQGWAFLMACAYCFDPSDRQEVECLIRDLGEKGFVRLPSGSPDSVEITESGRARVEGLRKGKGGLEENQER